MILELNRESHVPLYAQIVSEVCRRMTDGALKVGDRLPANRELAKTLGVNRNTVTTAYAELAADGLISSRVGSGTYVSRLPLPASTDSFKGRGLTSPMSSPLSSPMLWDALLTLQTRDNWLAEMSSL